MEQKGNAVFQFRNSVSPRYIEPLLIQLQNDRWYSTTQLVHLLHKYGLNIEGTDIVSHNTLTWSLAGLGQIEKRREGTKTINMFRLTGLGKYLIDIYGTNHDLFYDLMHFMFYSTYYRLNDIRSIRFWLYANVCDTLWREAPTTVDTLSLTNRLQIESSKEFPKYDPSFSERSVVGISPWLQTLVPPFLTKQGTKSHLYSVRRNYCSPQLFHLATDMVYRVIEGIPYGVAFSIDEKQIESICKVCLLNPARFWEMADLTQMTINGYDLHRGQWGTSLTLANPPTWIPLPDFSHKNEREQVDTDVFVDADGGEE